jgi:PPM family protein phosphatase
VLHAYGASDRGPVRPSNQDCFGIDEQLGLCVIADGMGGHNAGEVAARIVVDALLEHVRRVAAARSGTRRPKASSLHPFGIDPALSDRGNVLRNGILLANVQVLETAGSADRYAGMGTTVVAAQAIDGRLIAAHAGDSRLYLLSGGALRQVTSDDSWMATMLAREPGGDPARFRHHPMRHALTNVVGGRARTEAHVVEESLSGGELLLLSTDGVHGVLDEPLLRELMMAGEEPSEIARAIVSAALERGTQDNATAVVARYV